MINKNIIQNTIKIILGILILIVSILYLSFRSPLIQNIIKNTIASKFTHRLESDINIGDLSFHLPFNINIKELNCSQKDLTYLFVKNINISIAPQLSWPLTLKISSITADEININDIPNFKQKPNISISEKSKDMAFPYKIYIDKISANKINIAPKVSGLSDYIKISYNSSNIKLSVSKDQVYKFSGSNTIFTTQEGINDIKINASGQYETTTNLVKLYDIDVKSQIGTITGELLLNAKKNIIVSSDFHYKANNLFKFFIKNIPDTKDDISLNIVALGDISEPSIHLNGKLLTDISSKYFHYPELFIKSDIKFHKTGVINASIELKQNEVIATGDIIYKDSTLHLNNWTANGPDFIKTANVEFDSNTKIMKGKTTVLDNTLYITSGLWPFFKNGKLDVKMLLSSKDNITQDITLDAKLTDLSNEYGIIDLISLQIQSHDIWNTKSIQSNLILKGARTNNFDRIDLNLNSTLKLDQNNNLIGKISDLLGNINDVPFYNTQDISITYDQHLSINMDKIYINNNGYIKFIIKKEGLDRYLISLFDNIPINKIYFTTDAPWTPSSCNGEVKLLLNKDNPIIKTNLDIDLSNKTMDSKINVVSSITKKLTNIDLKFITSQDLEVLDCGLIMHNDFSIYPFRYNIDSYAPLKGNLKIKNNTSSIFKILPSVLKGKFTSSVSGGYDIKGTLAKPELYGTIKIFDGHYINPIYGLSLYNISSTIESNGNTIILKDLFAQDVFKNILTCKGELKLQDKNDFFIDILANNIWIASTKMNLEGKLNGNLLFNGNKLESKIEGSLLLNDAILNYSNTLKSNIAKLNTVIVNNTKKNASYTPSFQENFLNLNINLNLGENVYIKNSNIDALLSGKLDIQGNIYKPKIYGRLRSIHGHYYEFGKVLNISEGFLTFEGLNAPNIYIVGTTDVSGIKIRLTLSNFLLNHPQLTIKSIPELPEQELLSLLLFGNKSNNISPIQSLQIAEASNVLSNNKNLFDPWKFSRELLGVDSIILKNEEDKTGKSKYAVGVTKRLSKNIYFELEKYVTGGKTKVAIQLTPKVSIESSINADYDSELGIYYKFDY